MPQHPVKGVDHVFLLVNDLDASRDAYERLGFIVSPRGMHSAHKGTANHTVMFPNDYLELLGLVAETEDNRPRRALLERDGEGLRAVACRVDDAAAAEPALAELGIATDGLSDFSRPVELPGGGEGVAAFTTLQFHPDEVPVGMSFMCQHRTRDTVYVPALFDHPNSAVGLGAIFAAPADPHAAADGFARLFAAGAVSEVAGGFRVETGPQSAPIVLLDEAALATRYEGLDLSALPRSGFAALQIRVRSLDDARAALRSAGIEAAATEAGIAVPPAAASGTVLEFVAD